MEIDNLEQAKELLENIKYFFTNFDQVSQKLNVDLINKELERDDLLHEIELSKLNAVERLGIYGKLEKTLQERRIIKDKIELINTMRTYKKKYIEKGICGDTDTAIKNIDTLQNNQKNRRYTPRILKDLKCAKERKVQENQKGE